MVKLTPGECFSRACDAYERAKALIAELTEKTKELAKDFNGEVAMRQFDLIIQAILLNLAVEDGELAPVEISFIENIAEYGSVLDTVNREMKEQSPTWRDMGWGDIASLSPEYQGKFATIVAAVVEKYANEFTYFFSAIDYIDEKDYERELTYCLFELILMLDAVDEGGYDPDEALDDERLRALSAFEILFKDKWKENTDRFKKAIEESDEG